MSYFVTSDGVKIYYEDSVTGEHPIVLMHGGFVNHTEMLPAYDYFSAKGYRTVTFDARGHGKSDALDRGNSMDRWAKDLEELMDYLGLNNVVLQGYSFSVQVVLNYVKLFGCKRLSHIVLMDQSVKWISDDTWKFGIYLGTYTLEAAFEDMHNMENDMSFTYKKLCGVTADSDIPGFVMQFPYHTAKSMMCELARGDYRDVLPTIMVPTLVVFGEPGQLFLKGEFEYIAEHIPNSKLISFPGGHGFYYADPNGMHEAMLAFIEEPDKQLKSLWSAD